VNTDVDRDPHANITLLGDSILDNATYTAGGPAVIDEVRPKFPAEWDASLLAIKSDNVSCTHPGSRRFWRRANLSRPSASGPSI